MTDTDVGVVLLAIGGGIMAFALALFAVWCVVRVVKMAWGE